MIVELCHKALANSFVRKTDEAQENQRLLDKHVRQFSITYFFSIQVSSMVSSAAWSRVQIMARERIINSNLNCDMGRA